MKQLLFVCIIALLLATSSGSFGQEQGTGMLFLRQTDSPAVLVQTTHSLTDLLQSAKLKNVSGDLVTGYRIGWVVVYSTGKEKTGLGLPVDVPSGIRAGATADVPAQGVSADSVKDGAIAVVFFVTDVRVTGNNGSVASKVWKAELPKIEEQALAMTKSQ